MASSPRTLVLETSVHVDAPPAAVWEVLMAVQRWPEWSRDCVEATLHDAGLDAPGAELSFRLRMLGIPVPFAPTVTSADPPHELVWTSRKWTVTGTRTHRLEPLDGGTRVVDRKQFTHAWLPIAWFYPRPVITRMSRRWLDDLAARFAGR